MRQRVLDSGCQGVRATVASAPGRKSRTTETRRRQRPFSERAHAESVRRVICAIHQCGTEMLGCEQYQLRRTFSNRTSSIAQGLPMVPSMLATPSAGTRHSLEIMTRRRHDPCGRVVLRRRGTTRVLWPVPAVIITPARQKHAILIIPEAGTAARLHVRQTLLPGNL
jgi:hypothetical protein